MQYLNKIVIDEWKNNTYKVLSCEEKPGYPTKFKLKCIETGLSHEATLFELDNFYFLKK